MSGNSYDIRGAGKIEFEDENIDVYRNGALVFNGRYDEYFDDEFADDLCETHEYNPARKIHVGHGIADGWLVAKKP